MSTLNIGNLKLEPGQRARGVLGTFYQSDGTKVSIPLMGVRGKQEGPVLWLSAAMHGQELSGIPVVWEIIKQHTDPDTLRGAVVGAPILNPFSFNGRTYFTPEDGYNVNRVFPGDPNGLLTHRLANLIYEEAVTKSDYLIDFHCNVSSAMYFSIIKGSEQEEAFRESRKMADAFGVTTIEMILKHEAHRTGTMSDEARKAGKPMLVLELIPWRMIYPEAVRVGVRGTLNVMKHLGMIDGEPDPQDEIDVLGGRLSRTELNVSRGGLIDKFVDVGDRVEKGQLLGQVVDGYGEPVEDIVSTVDGWLLAWPMIHNQAAGSGDHVAFLAFPIEE
ncbi:MAG TPA: succinylglutamate desuccinylase/aspartoacylase family protein [Candidatus Sulfomarinibacteraceae bacterium]|nr:succinylglutamate desuccinylase/aspartoacylase family protein [Candidatus Sulfomarinibacteraceae bacterium]